MQRYEARPLPGHIGGAWGVFDNTAQTFVAWLEGPPEAMARRADKYNAQYERAVAARRRPVMG